MAKHKPTFYDLNIMIWEDDGEFTFSVIQEFDESGKDVEVLAKGSGMTMQQAIDSVRDTLFGALVSE